MRDLSLTIVLACLLAAGGSACSGKQSPPVPPSSAGGTQTITGRERLGWDQEVADADELSHYSFVLYVDGVPVVLGSATCGAPVGEGPSADCSSPLPALSVGRHTLELGTRLTWGDSVLESARATPLVVMVTGFVSSGSSSQRAPATEVPGQNLPPYVIETLASGLDRPSALAALPDGRLLIVERRGRVRVAERGLLLDAPAVVLPDADPGIEVNSSLAVAADFAATRHVYVSYVARDREGTRIGRVVRFRELGGILGQPAVILDGLPAQSREPRTRIGPDGALYIATTALDPRDSGDLASYAGKLLRFTTAGETPLDNPIRFSPVLSLGHRGRLDFDWEPPNNALWYVETDPGGISIGRPNPGRSAERTLYLEGIQAADVAFHAGSTPAAWRNSLFLASPDQECLYRVTGLSSSPPNLVVERLLANRFGRIAAVLSAEDGLYFATGNGGTDDRGQPADAVFRVSEKVLRFDSPVRRQR